MQSEALAIPAIALFGRPVIFRKHLQKTQAAMRKDVQPTLTNSNPWCLSRGRRTKLLLQRTSLPRWPPPRRNQRYRPYCSAICPCMSCIDLEFQDPLNFEHQEGPARSPLQPHLHPQTLQRSREKSSTSVESPEALAARPCGPRPGGQMRSRTPRLRFCELNLDQQPHKL